VGSEGSVKAKSMALIVGPNSAVAVVSGVFVAGADVAVMYSTTGVAVGLRSAAQPEAVSVVSSSSVLKRINVFNLNSPFST
jgi:hypothetical protein